MKLRTLLILQFTFAILSLSYLAASYLRETQGDGPLSAAPIIPSMISFVIYSTFLVAGVLRKHTLYRVLMGIAVVGYGSTGVVLNIVNYFLDGQEDYSSLGAWILAVAINSYGTIWNVLAMFGIYKDDDKDDQA